MGGSVKEDMQGKRQTRRGWQAGLAVGAMVGLCGLLGVLQYAGLAKLAWRSGRGCSGLCRGA